MDSKAALIGVLVTALLGILGWAAVDTITQVDSNKGQLSELGSRVSSLEKADEQQEQRLDTVIERVIQMMAGSREQEKKEPTIWPQTP